MNALLTTWNVSQVSPGKAQRCKSTRNWPDYCGMSQNECAPSLGWLNSAVCSASPPTSKLQFETRLEEIDWLRRSRGSIVQIFSGLLNYSSLPLPSPLGAATNQPNWPSTLNLARLVMCRPGQLISRGCWGSQFWLKPDSEILELLRF